MSFLLWSNHEQGMLRWMGDLVRRHLFLEISRVCVCFKLVCLCLLA